MKDLEFHVDRPDGTTLVTKNFDDAASLAISIACSNGQPVNIDVLAYSRAAARAWDGEDGVESYNEDPDASIFDRIVIRAESLGRIA
jgi:hypothetical protein